MEVATLIIAVVALVLGLAAFMRTGGIRDLRHQLDAVSARTEAARDRTADLLDRLERLVRGREKPQAEKEGETGGPSSSADRP
jgi:hypothetical protein